MINLNYPAINAGATATDTVGIIAAPKATVAELAAAIAEVGITLSCFELRVPWGPIKKYFSIE